MATSIETTTPWERVRGHWAGPAWLRSAHVVTGFPIALAAVAVIGGLTAASIVLIWTVVVPVISLMLLFRSVPIFTRVQRNRFNAFLGLDIPQVPRRVPASWNPFKVLYMEAKVASTWRQLGYHLLAPLIAGIGSLLVILAWSGALVAIAIAVQIWIEDGTTWRGTLAMLVAMGLLVTGPWVARGVSALDEYAAAALLGPSLKEQLAQRVETLRESRAEVIDAADTERRRIERDLHDGTQQRLVWLAMNLGMARATLTDLPEPAVKLISQAHEEAKLALKELRDLVQGLHPAVLNDQGLDAALSGIAARAPVPVRLNVDVKERVTPTIEAVAFFVVSETLTNIAKHAAASSAQVLVWREGDRLHLVVHDDGEGGADPARGSGLRGLAQRVGSVDGDLRIDSPPGGPTTIRVELPCA
ncbi:sensor histidine kinase [Acrocarpospora pleiomorpha]|uniref:sensor histidine kinase n=1 Tax=Acrocarpospora pleiomorpha TaxID=90975 RepID=UPI0012D32246|nr:sensor histidine kinase [Acrocarpospora pleiomorpha]